MSSKVPKSTYWFDCYILNYVLRLFVLKSIIIWPASSPCFEMHLFCFLFCLTRRMCAYANLEESTPPRGTSILAWPMRACSERIPEFFFRAHREGVISGEIGKWWKQRNALVGRESALVGWFYPSNSPTSLTLKALGRFCLEIVGQRRWMRRQSAISSSLASNGSCFFKNFREKTGFLFK